MNVRHPVYVVHADAALRGSLRLLLSHAGHRPVAFAQGAAFLSEAAQLEAGCVLLDLHMDGLDGLAVQRRLRARGIIFPIIFVTGHGDVPTAVAAMKQGAIDFLAAPFAQDALLRAIDRAMARLDDEARLHALRDEAIVQLNALTPREREVFRELARGLPNKSIAHDLGISPRTVEIHRANLMQKLNVRSFPEALRLAFTAGLPDECPAPSG